MSELLVFHVDDDSDTREIVEISLKLDPDLAVLSCASGGDAIAATYQWSPDLFLLDVRMPGMDGTATMGRMRENSLTTNIPVVFMTALARPSEINRLHALGAQGVISKPFDPLTLAATVRNYIRKPAARFVGGQGRFLKRARNDVTVLKRDLEPVNGPTVLRRISSIAHRISGGGGTVGFAEISDSAFALEQIATAAIAGTCSNVNVERAIDELITVIERAQFLAGRECLDRQTE